LQDRCIYVVVLRRYAGHSRSRPGSAISDFVRVFLLKYGKKPREHKSMTHIFITVIVALISTAIASAIRIFLLRDTDFDVKRIFIRILVVFAFIDIVEWMYKSLS